MPVGHDLPSCTNQVVASETFTIDGQEMVLFDTPGFDDTTISDADTLKRIAEFLETMYRRGIKLKGIVYLHRITDMRMTGASARTYRLLRSLCGSKNLANVVIVTNMWSDPPTEDEILREQQLRSNFFKSALEDGAQLLRREHLGQTSAHEVLRTLLPKAAMHPQLPVELSEGIPLQDTEAGRIVRAEIEAKLSKQDEELQELRDEIRAMVVDRNLKAERELDEYRGRKEREMSLLRQQLASLTVEIEEGRKFWEGQFEDMRTRRIQAMRLAEEQILLDTPGFDDEEISDVGTLKRIAGYLSANYDQGQILSGIIYLHRITDNRMGGANARTFNLFRKMCGTQTLKNVIIATNMWSNPPTDTQARREQQLETDFFKEALDGGARMFRRETQGRESAHRIIRQLIGQAPLPMRIDVETVDENRALHETEAGQAIEVRLLERVNQQQEAIEEARRELAHANLEGARAAANIRAEVEREEREMAELRQQIDSLRRGMEEERRDYWRRLEAERAQFAEDQGTRRRLGFRRKLREFLGLGQKRNAY
ncbi:hypothetical protein RhiXN_06826 [Rhizoctonia solani]|uniref:G domain-containing protein n=1 Tax=Rhizoctonia solani TaxID=456999 RepID=A0A8H8SYR5_9AGAM|nr:uncharacterized protein RhiXN_06826 [Rhizoctonia solani]QRW21837.1 hypothetical protein RhiXN_06826 [Rhizoctonia solani]